MSEIKKIVYRKPSRFITPMIEIFEKNSTSPTIVICRHDLNKIYKIWVSEPVNEMPDYYETLVRGLEYENLFYRNITKPIVETLFNDKNYVEIPPLLKYKETVQNLSFERLAEVLGIQENEREATRYLRTWLIIYIKSLSEDFFLNSVSVKENFLRNYRFNGTVTNFSGGCLSLGSYMEKTFERRDDEKDDEKITLLLARQFCKFLEADKYIFLKNSQHNDAHTGNMLVTENGNYLFFDWDRSFAEELGENKFIEEFHKDELPNKVFKNFAYDLCWFLWFFVKDCKHFLPRGDFYLGQFIIKMFKLVFPFLNKTDNEISFFIINILMEQPRWFKKQIGDRTEYLSTNRALQREVASFFGYQNVSDIYDNLTFTGARCIENLRNLRQIDPERSKKVFERYNAMLRLDLEFLNNNIGSLKYKLSDLRRFIKNKRRSMKTEIQTEQIRKTRADLKEKLHNVEKIIEICANGENKKKKLLLKKLYETETMTINITFRDYYNLKLDLENQEIDYDEMKMPSSLSRNSIVLLLEGLLNFLNEIEMNNNIIEDRNRMDIVHSVKEKTVNFLEDEKMRFNFRGETLSMNIERESALKETPFGKNIKSKDIFKKDSENLNRDLRKLKISVDNLCKSDTYNYLDYFTLQSLIYKLKNAFNPKIEEVSNVNKEDSYYKSIVSLHNNLSWEKPLEIIGKNEDRKFKSEININKRK